MAVDFCVFGGGGRPLPRASLVRHGGRARAGRPGGPPSRRIVPLPPRLSAVSGLASRAPRRAHRPCPVVRSRCGRARCPHRAASPRGRAHRRARATSLVVPLDGVRGHPRSMSSVPLVPPPPRASLTGRHRPWGLPPSRPGPIAGQWKKISVFATIVFHSNSIPLEP